MTRVLFNYDQPPKKIKRKQFNSGEFCIPAAELPKLSNEDIAKQLNIPTVYATSYVD
jgi:hypothetical protein